LAVNDGTGVPATAGGTLELLELVVAAGVYEYVPIDVSTLGKVLPLSSAKAFALMYIVIVPVSDDGGVNEYV
jgi:hypothetical protein